MLAAATNLLPAARNFARQIVPPVLATLIAALLIAGFNRAFSSHLVQPRMAALHDSSDQAPRPIVYAANPHAAVAVTEALPLAEATVAERSFAKGTAHEAGKDQTAFKVATAPVPAAATARTTRRSELPAEPRPIEPRQAEPRIAAVPYVVPPPVAVAPAPIVTVPRVVAQPIAPPVTAQPVAPIAQQPIAPMPPPPMPQQFGAPQPIGQPIAPPVAPMAQQPMMAPVAQQPPAVIAAQPMVTVPDRPRTNQSPAYPANPYDPRQPYPYYGQQQADADQDAARPREPRPLERFVDALRPSSIFNHIRQFGDRIEAAGNDILPTIRQ